MGTWSLRGQVVEPLSPWNVPSESQLEDLLEVNPQLIFDGEPLLVIGRQRSTDLGRAMDLLAIDASGAPVVIEPKKHRTTREVVAQVLEYVSYIATLDYASLDALATEYFQFRGAAWSSLQEAHTAKFRSEAAEGTTSIAWNGRQRTVVAAEEVTEDIARVCRYLRKSGVNISALQVAFLEDQSGDRIINTDVVVGREPMPGEQPAPVSADDIEERIPPGLQPLFLDIRSTATKTFRLREKALAMGFSFEPVPNPRGLVLMGLYLAGADRASLDKAGLYVYRRATETLGGDADAFYQRLVELGFDTQPLAEKGINLRPTDLARLESFWEAFRTYVMPGSPGNEQSTSPQSDQEAR